MVKIKIDGIEYEVDEKKNLISAAKDVGIDIPFFCYHPKLSIVGMCRMCLIEIEGVPRLQAACNTKVAEGLSIFTKNDRIKEAREGTMEFLLANHPLDCPVCDKAGECQLQDNAFQEGNGNSRFTLEKRNVPQEEIGTNLIINHNRCIVCYRCVRFEEEIVGESNLGLFERGYHSIIGLAKSEPIQHNFQGALADLCPTGALLNNKTLFKSRVWWYKNAESICHGCSTGCNITTNVRDNKMYRYMPRIDEEKDMYFLCDTGRFDIDWLNENRLFAYYRNGNISESAVVLSAIAEKILNAKKIAILGGATESNENLKTILQSVESFGKSVIVEARVNAVQYKAPEQKDFLMTTDLRQNTKGAVDAGFVSSQGIESIRKSIESGEIDLVFVIKENRKEFLPSVSSNTTLVVLETNETQDVANAAYGIPIQTFAEQSGSFTNKSGLNQLFQKAMEPPKGLLNSGSVFRKLAELVKESASSPKEAGVGNR
ncbi:NADH-ubiquinone oxidoreductase-G iron-sulfur binding region [Leptospira weilii str. 2006001853]|uniref:NADH-ubiquinone oxidoreductase-G iron-sulfur binding region n=1 Tax=Leptospira weilii str. 2006001853 TaxID=1001589 RepID=A0A828YVB9_9LEPT|nr:2Fe-2S iron-sulfur cluster-binding protein [Leptospira weilii]EKR62689.1 NADH-ubiquinone oxidoreductase-G iron-sulfur binding region [Leptospira weilii str. 2006001853]EMN46055.1 NADH-ubiquinone oxidoreductase-G iron-sulfur binding region [Leptospira weilii str. LNT 1234]QDK21441.1 2Fe-2S iron-sulfur cluster binding domain-containing protein [Leptospira weilii]QDK25405.1 2Fe-2S iron-sulfur cluster binding domain-containing protein [Leptospira weilii]